MKKSFSIIVAGAVALAFTGPAFAIKPFTLVEGGYPERVGAHELEQSFGFSWQTKGDPGAISADHELEYETGIKEDFTLRLAGAYVFDHSADGDALHFDGAKLEGQYYFSNPAVDDIGLSAIGAVVVGERSLTFEGILVAQKDFEKWTVAANLGASTTISGVFDNTVANETEGALSFSAGAIYDLGNKFKIGGEFSAEAIFPDWANLEKTNVYAGPCVNWVPTDNIWVTAGVSYNISGHDDESRVIGGLIVGYYFN